MSNEIKYIRSTAQNTSCLSPIQFKSGRGGWGMVLGVVASIAVPFIAPTLAAGIFGGAATALQTGLVGAGLGAAAGAGSAALSGGDIMRGALFGGVAGGLSSGVVGAAGTNSLLNNTVAPGADPWAALRTTTGAAATGGGASAGLTAGLTTDPSVSTGSFPVDGAVTGAGTVQVGGQATQMSQLTQSLIRSSPQILGQVVGAMTGQDQARYAAQLQDEIEAARNRDEVAYQQKLKLFNEFSAQAKNIDPQFESHLAQAAVLRRTAQQQRQVDDAQRITRNSDEARAAATRKANIENSLAGHSAGLNAGLNAQQRKIAATRGASEQFPRTPRAGLQNLQYLYNLEERRNDELVEGVSATATQFISPFTAQYGGTPSRDLFN